MKVEDLEDFTKNKFNIPNVNYDGLDRMAILNIILAMHKVMKKYPALKNSICSIGSNEYNNIQINLLKNTNKLYELKWHDIIPDDEAVLSAVYEIKSRPVTVAKQKFTKLAYTCISYRQNLEKHDMQETEKAIRYSTDIGFHPRHCNNFQSYIYHEIGHVLDGILNLNTDAKLLKIIKQNSGNFRKIPTDISMYAITDIKETIAEAFSEYMICPNSNKLVNAIGKYIDKKYELFANSRIFKINYKYGNNLEDYEERKIKRRKK